jgi:hypothetical protein
LEPSNKNGLFVGYSETSKASRVFIPKQRKTIVCQDVNFEEDFASKKSHEPIPVAEDEEQEAPKVETRSPVISRAITQPSSEQRETGTPTTYVKRPRWFSRTLRNAQEHV